MPQFHPYPMAFRPVLKPKVWGGRQLREFFPAARENTGEAWLLSDRGEGATAVANGRYRGLTIGALMEKNAAAILGPKLAGKYGRRYPLLFKMLATSGRLSVQVHPDDATAAKKGLPSGKTEMWYVMRASKGAEIFTGFKTRPAARLVRSAAADGTLPSMLKRYAPKKGEAYFIPAGTVHAIGAGCVLLEIQQNSDTTYRLYDWGRTGRELSIADAVGSIRQAGGSGRVRPGTTQRGGGMTARRLADSPYFRAAELVVEKGAGYWYNGNNHCVITVAEGTVEMLSGGKKYVFRAGMAALLPYSLGGLRIKAAAKARMIVTEAK